MGAAPGVGVPFDGRDLGRHRLELSSDCVRPRASPRGRANADQHDQGVADLAELLAIGADPVEHASTSGALDSPR